MRIFTKTVAFLSQQRVVSVLLWIVGVSFAEMFIRNGIRKFDAEGFWSRSFLETWGYPLWFMYFIGVVELVSGLALLVPRLRPWGSGVLAVVMLGALGTRAIFGLSEGLATEAAFNFYKDLLFFLSTIAMFLFFIAYGNAQSRDGILPS